MNKFKNSDGTLSAYALECGYIEKFEINEDRISLEKDPGIQSYHIKGFIKGKRIWEVTNKRREAYKIYKSMVKTIKIMNGDKNGCCSN